MAIEKLILGTVQFGLPYGINNRHGQLSMDQAFEVLDLAYQNGIRYLDTAGAYGQAEEVLGHYHSKREFSFEIITKLHFRNGENWDLAFKRSLTHLRKGKVWALLFHSLSDFEENKQILPALIDLKAQGAIKQIGVSVYTNEEVECLLQFPEIDLIQLPFNLLDNLAQRGKVLRAAKDTGKIIHTRSVFLQGLFFKPVEELPKVLSPLRPYLTAIRQVAVEAKLSLAELALGYVLHQPDIDGVLVGVDNIEQLESNLKAANINLPISVMHKINHLVAYCPDLLNPSKWESLK